MKFEIRNRWSGGVQFECELEAKFETESIYVQLGAAVKVALKSGARLDGASLDGARLVGARLDGARLVGASLVGARLDGASLVGARLDGASLDGARLVGARLDGARLDGASLDGASGEKLKLVGPRPVVWFGPIGREQRTVYAFLTDKGVYVRAGCFWNTIESFERQVSEVHGTTEHAQEYEAFLILARMHFKMWSAS